MIEDWIISLIASWLPFIVICAIWMAHGRQIRRSMTTLDGRSIAQILDDLVREMKRANDLRGADSQRTTGTAPSAQQET